MKLKVLGKRDSILFRGVFLGAFFVFGLVSCTQQPSLWTRFETTPEIRIGEFGSMTGAESSYGIYTHKGILLAVEEANARGGIKGKKINVIHYDTKSDPVEAVKAVNKLIQEDKVHVLLGEVASALSLVAAPVAQANKTPMITPASTHPKVTEVGDYIFRSCFIEPFQGSVMAKFALNNLNLKKAAILKDESSEYSLGLANFFSQDFQKLGGTILAQLSYASGDTDFSKQLKEIKLKRPDILFIPGYYHEVATISQEARKMGIKAVLLGGDGWDSRKLTELGKDSVLGSYFSNHFSSDDKSPTVQAFVERFRSRFGELPNGPAALGYDAANLAIDAILRSADLQPKTIRDSISSTRNFPGVTGLISINQKRNAVKPAVVLKVEKSGKYSYEATINP